MKIIHYLSYPGYGGAEKYTLNIAMEAVRDGHEVLFVLDSDGPLTEQLKRANLKFRILAAGNGFVLNKYLVGYLKFKKVVKNFRPDIIHTHFLRENIIAGLAKSQGSKLVRTVHRLDRFNNFAHRFSRKVVNRTTTNFIAPSKYAAQLMVREGYPEPKITVIYNGGKEIKATSPKENIVGVLSRLERGKGVLELVENLPERFNEFRILIAGAGDEEGKIKRLIENRGLKTVEMLGRVDNITDFFSKISLLLHPSSNESTLPMSVIEALSLGREAVVFDIPALKEFEGPGLIKVSRGDWKGLREEVLKQLDRQDYTAGEIKEYFRTNFGVEKLWSGVRKVYQS